VVGEDDDLVRTGCVAPSPGNAAELLVELAQGFQRVGALQAGVVGDLVVAGEGRVDGGAAAHHVGEHAEDDQIADHHAHRRAQERVDTAAVTTRAHVAPNGANRGGPLEQHLPDEQHQRSGDVEAVGEKRAVAGVGSLLGVDSAHREDHLVGFAREQVASAGATVCEQPDPGRAAALDLGAVGGRRAAHHGLRFLLDPPEGGNVLVRAEQDARLAGAGLRGEVGLPLGEAVAVVGDPSCEVGSVAVSHRRPQDRKRQTVDFEKDDAGRIGASHRALASCDPLYYPERVLVVVVGAGQHGDYDRNRRHQKRGKQSVAERADGDDLREPLVCEHQRPGIDAEDEQEPTDERERQPERRHHRRQHRIDDRDRRGDDKGTAGVVDLKSRQERRGEVHGGACQRPRDDQAQGSQSRLRRLPFDRRPVRLVWLGGHHANLFASFSPVPDAGTTARGRRTGLWRPGRRKDNATVSEGDARDKTGRRALPIIIIVLATVVGIVSVFALWAKRQLLESETWSTTSEELIQNAEIQDAVSTFIVTAIFDNVDVEAQIAERLPPRAAPLAGPAAGALRSAADDVALKALEQPRVQELWVEANAAAQSKLIALIEDKGEFVSTTGGVVTIDLKSLLESVTDQLGLGADLVTKLPPEATSIEVMKSSELDAAQKGVNLLQTIGWVLTALTLLLYATAIFLAGDRRRAMLRSVGFSFILVGAFVLFARSAAGNLVVDSLSEAASSDDAVSAVFEIGTSLLLETAQSIIAYGIVIVLAAWLAGSSTIATSIRRAITPQLRQPSYAYGGLALLLSLVFWWDPVVATHRLVPSLILIALAALGTEMLRRQVIREFPDRVTSGSTAGIAQGLAERMREGRERHVSAAGGDERVADIERLTGLRDSGALTEQEFAAEKARILGSGSTA
jgi:hypothetical protein